MEKEKKGKSDLMGNLPAASVTDFMGDLRKYFFFQDAYFSGSLEQQEININVTLLKSVWHYCAEEEEMMQL